MRNLSEITIEPINSTSSRTSVSKNWGEGLGKIWGPVPAWSQRRTATVLCVPMDLLSEINSD